MTKETSTVAGRNGPTFRNAERGTSTYAKKEDSAKQAQPIAPRSLRLRGVIVAATILIAMLALILGRQAAIVLGIDPTRLQGSGFVPGPLTIGLFLAYQVFQILIVLAAQRYLHRQPIARLGFGKAIFRNFTRGFAIGITVTGAMYALGVSLSVLLTGSEFHLAWAVPEETPLVTLLVYYVFFFVVFLTANSFGEELVYRCYPIEQFRDTPRLMLAAAVGATLLFAAVHFVIGAFDLFWFLGLLGFAFLCATLYIHTRSVWLIVGLHNGTGFVSYSLSGNWKVGGLFQLQLSAPSGVAFLGSLVGTYALAIWLSNRLCRAKTGISLIRRKSGAAQERPGA